MHHTDIPVSISAQTVRKIISAVNNLPEFVDFRNGSTLNIDLISDYIICKWVDGRLKEEGKE